jgi:nicotinamidase/pyrazinamidase
MNGIKSPESYDQIVSINVDIQNDFCPGGSLAVTDGNEIVEPMNRVNKYVRELGGIVIFTRDWHPRVTSHFNTQGGPWPPHCIAYQAGAAFHDDLIVDTQAGDLVASKGMSPTKDDYSGLMAVMDDYTTIEGRGDIVHPSLSRYLQNGIRYKNVRESWGSRSVRVNKLAVVVGGLATDYCVKATVLDLAELAKSRDIDVYLIQDAIRAVNIHPEDGEQAVAEMVQAGAIVITSDGIVSGELKGAAS